MSCFINIAHSASFANLSVVVWGVKFFLEFSPITFHPLTKRPFSLVNFVFPIQIIIMRVSNFNDKDLRSFAILLKS